jgi:glycolate oxidase iron-sulfur subunit
LPRATLFGVAMKLGQSVRLLALPGVPCAPRCRRCLPPGRRPGAVMRGKLIALAGCVQPSMYPNINGATRRVLDSWASR